MTAAAQEPASLLAGLRLATSRLELRLGSADEVLALGRLAERGIHLADEMPFAVAWTDAVGTPGFLDDFAAFHRAAVESWSPDDWSLNLLVFCAGELCGVQSLAARAFATERTVSTGSWLGRAHQRQGIGTEMRAGVLAFAFDGLGARAAVSGYLEGNDASRIVSERLGYSAVGEGVVEPRPGEPVRHFDVRLERSSWRPLAPVTIEGLAPCLPLFGITPRGASALA